jgi:hypothetical protein
MKQPTAGSAWLFLLLAEALEEELKEEEDCQLGFSRLLLQLLASEHRSSLQGIAASDVLLNSLLPADIRPNCATAAAAMGKSPPASSAEQRRG